MLEPLNSSLVTMQGIKIKENMSSHLKANRMMLNWQVKNCKGPLKAPSYVLWVFIVLVDFIFYILNFQNNQTFIIYMYFIYIIYKHIYTNIPMLKLIVTDEKVFSKLNRLIDKYAECLIKKEYKYLTYYLWKSSKTSVKCLK